VDKGNFSQVARADCRAEGDISEDGSCRQTAIYAAGDSPSNTEHIPNM